MNMLKVVGFGLMISCAACSSIGTKCDFDAMKRDIKIGATAMNDVYGMCGEPMFKEIDMKDKSEVWHYAYIEKNLTGLGVLTKVVGLGAEVTSKRNIMDIQFQNGVVIDVKGDESTITKMHLQ